MHFAPRHWLRRLLASLEAPALEAGDRLRRIEVVELHIILPLKVAAILMLVHSFRTSPWFGLAMSSLDVAVETVQTISVIYVAMNILFTGMLVFLRRLPFAVVQWSVFGISLADAVFLAGVTVLTGGYDSILYWLFVGLIARNAASIPPAWSQVVLNLCVCLCYVLSGVLDIAVTESAPEAYTAGPRSVLLAETDLRNPAVFIEKLRRGVDPVSSFLWHEFPPRTQAALADARLPLSDRAGRLVEELNRVLRSEPIYDEQRFAELNLRQRTRSLLATSPVGERMILLNRLLLEDAYPADVAHSQAPRQMMVSESTAETPPTEPLVLRLFVLVLTAACCYGIQVLFEKQRLAVEEAREFGIREGQLRSAGRLAAEIAHRLKNPLAIINTAAFSLERGLKTGKGAAERQLGIIKEEVERADRTITQLMGYAQLCEGHVERLDVAAELAQAIRTVFPPGAGYAAQVKCDCAPHLPPLLMQRSHLSEVLANLLLNARDATGGGGRITVTARATADHTVEIQIADDGPGIPANKLERIFEAYYSTKEKGTGLGLAIAKHNVELYGGTLRVESELGRGARFSVVFPKTRI